ncbi:VirB4-like conjugal transfer ATPase, CD1110 family [Acidipropionibacterium jensenii]|uniref:VirB4-like conjugal transfer ATPase, CD1110 family n=1 Tax=Acidipropionibacterium jensenii TaxID=1749 RepID=UPI00345449F0
MGRDHFSVTWQISDVMYQNSGEKEAARIASAWQSFIQGFEAGESVQLSVINRRLSDDEMASAHQMSRAGDGADWVRDDYDELLRRRMSSLRNNITTDKYLTVTARATSAEHAETVFNRLGSQVEHDLRKVGGCQATRLGWAERVRLLASLTRPGEPIMASAPGPDGTGVLVESKDLIAPMAVDRKPRRDRFVLYGDRETHGTSLVLRDLAPDLYDDLLQKLAEVNTVMAISVQMSPMARDDSIERVKRARQGLQMQMINELHKNEKQNLSERFLPHDLTIQADETDGLLEKLENSNESLVPTCMVVTVFANSQDELVENVAQLRAVAKQRSCPLSPLSFMQMEGLNETLPLGGRFTPVSFDLTSDAAAMFIPFTNQDIDVPGGVIYGTNQITKNLVAIDRSSGMNGNAFILGTSGGGKGFTTKNEIAQLAVGTGDDIIVIDPEREYRPIGEAFGASFIDVSASSNQCINPMDLEIDSQSGTDPIRQKAVSVLGMLDTLIGGPEGLSQHEQSVIDRCVRRCYRPEIQGLVGEVPTPTLRALYDQLMIEAGQDDPVAASVAQSLELFTSGSYSGFSNETNVDTSNRFLVYDLYKLESGLRTFGLMVILDQIWNRIVRNRARHVKTHLYIDEFHLMFATPLAAEQLRSFYQRARKYGLLATGVTQNVSQLLDSPAATMMLANSAMVILLPMGDTERNRIAELKRLSEDEADAIGEEAEQGTGLILTGPARIPFDNKIPDDLRIFDLFDTSPEAMA